ncbi:MAG: Rod shape-determining protein RodA [Candidatus Magasanikbacteria bacterium GW2011_GWD2_43_18]|uniref:Probable peptidoglycan glycosyltransferase FtsW n=1 Tax=Candidatus Magasanikbacteria bacterium GW2011_GWE2_42_7 TaxID=1619052 RepID=A0A0G1BG81_9BACT|nr:MAG: Rod shape-determining protein RodA [Candidatus Magasanikbacteria bacterium GW2011_GWC2_42_27]KKS72307.1 MAG: Rod shape-determining protein RodA [Candidatus Magasanikbacteria bacterium GW2011_GWE2_42_7]KKT04663.1 MAG: Rod shape-determining protein RodA [Candidatus Magasanikbacteria bacterium GW2011_GWD2_43_18]HBB37970.1 rod shape-determining protein RodA [Candidatus Magasanikbacteria bacterium]HCC13278.1 rod shape-determining protein RodA [Candidatus Magasanikbacteria bacterium]
MIEKFFRLIRGYDWTLVIVVLLLSSIGLAAIYSVDLSKGDTLIYFPVQTIAFIIGLVALIVAASVHSVFYQSFSRIAYVGVLLLLVGVLFFGATIRGTTGWFRIFGFSLQPAELAKVSLILFLAWIFYRHGRQYHKWQFVLSTIVIVGIYVGLILLQPDLGSALILLSIWFGLLLFSNTKKRYIAFLLLLGVGAFLIGWFFLFQPYQKARLVTFLDPASDPLGAGYNVSQSVIAIGAGNMFGRGLGFGSQSQLHFLPEAQTDFIFAVIAEELGLVAVLGVFLLYSLLIWRIILLTRRCRDDFSVFVLLGIAILFFTQVVVNVGAATGVLPVTGVTLPFLSYGGSSLVINFFLIGIALSIARSHA